MYGKEMDDVFNLFSNWSGLSTPQTKYLLKESDEHYSMKFYLAGYEKEEVQVQISDERLVIKTTDNRINHGYVVKELQFNPKESYAKMKGGVLEVFLAKNKKSKLRDLKVD